MRKIYFLLLLSSCFGLFFLSIINNKKDENSYQNNYNSLKNIISDSISPACSSKFNNKFENSLLTIKELKIIIPNSRNWSRNLMTAFTDGSKNILDKYKKRFNSNIFVKNSNNEICELPAKIRISGDWKDHIRMKNGQVISSLDVRLIRGNINGVTKFKLFLPHTRYGSSEVITSLLLKEMGYLSPRSRMIKVNLNGQTNEMIFQEKAVKEMLEYNNLRESAILESDESLLWKLRAKKYGNNNGNIFPKIINTNWTKKNRINTSIGLEGVNILSRATLESWNRGGMHNEVTFSDDLLSNGNSDKRKTLSTFKAHLIALGAPHALYNHNRRFYFDPLDKSLIPIYYDGDSQIRELREINIYGKDLQERFLTRDIRLEDFDNAIIEISDIDLSNFKEKLKKSGVKITENELIRIRKRIIKNLTFLKEKHKLKLDHKFIDNPLKRESYENLIYGIIFYFDNDLFLLCKLGEENCTKTKLNNFELNKLLAGKFVKDNIKYYYLGDKFNPIYNEYSKSAEKEYLILNPYDDLYIKKFGNPTLNFDKRKKLMKIYIKNTNEKILIFNSKLGDWKIDVEVIETNKFYNPTSRIDTHLLTSLITIKDSNINGTVITIDGGQHEDSLNIINSSGNIESINIKNSFQDAIDFDFSDLRVNKIFVNNSGNDCLDTSSGNYFINEIDLLGCKDKGVSVGENSYLELNNAKIVESQVALVSKDSSVLILKKGLLRNNVFCAAAYNKKQEFGPSTITIPNNLCSQDKIAIQNFSLFEQK